MDRINELIDQIQKLGRDEPATSLTLQSIDFAEREVIHCDRRCVRAVEHFAAMRKHGIASAIRLAKAHVLESEARLTSAVNKLAFECCHLNS